MQFFRPVRTLQFFNHSAGRFQNHRCPFPTGGFSFWGSHTYNHCFFSLYKQWVSDMNDANMGYNMI